LPTLYLVYAFLGLIKLKKTLKCDYKWYGGVELFKNAAKCLL